MIQFPYIRCGIAPAKNSVARHTRARTNRRFGQMRLTSLTSLINSSRTVIEAEKFCEPRRTPMTTVLRLKAAVRATVVRGTAPGRKYSSTRIGTRHSRLRRRERRQSAYQLPHGGRHSNVSNGRGIAGHLDEARGDCTLEMIVAAARVRTGLQVDRWKEPASTLPGEGCYPGLSHKRFTAASVDRRGKRIRSCTPYVYTRGKRSRKSEARVARHCDSSRRW
jgi:hypothetical protein